MVFCEAGADYSAVCRPGSLVPLFTARGDFRFRGSTGAFAAASFPGSVLAGVHADVRRDPQGFRIFGVVWKDGDADAGTDLDCFSVEMKRFFEEFGKDLSDTGGVGAGHGLFKNDGELVASVRATVSDLRTLPVKSSLTFFSNWSPT